MFSKDGRKKPGEPGQKTKITFHRKPKKHNLNPSRPSPKTLPPPAPIISIPLYQSPTVPGISPITSFNLVKKDLGLTKCPFCPLVLSHSSLSLHLSSAHSQALFRCEVPGPDGSPCSQPGFLLVSELQAHLFSQHQQHTFIIDTLVRDKQILLPLDLRQYHCKICLNTAFHGKEGLSEAQEHLRKIHSRNDEGGSLLAYQCRACQSYKPESGKTLEKHIKHRHFKDNFNYSRTTRRPSEEVKKSESFDQVHKSSLKSSTSEQGGQQDTAEASTSDQETSDEPYVQVWTPATRPPPPTSRGEVAAETVEQGLQRCDLCPSPGLVQELDIHLSRSHRDSMFTCAPCGKGFLLLAELAEHIVTNHLVTDNVLERVLLPSEDRMLALQCGLCSRQVFGTESMAVIESHIFSTHKEGEIFVVCRVCDFTSSEEKVVRKHIEHEHPKEMFAVDSESEDENDNIKLERDPETVPFIERFSELCMKKKHENQERRRFERKRKKELRENSLDRSTSSEEDKEVVWIRGKPKKLSQEEFKKHMMMEISTNVFVKKFQAMREKKMDLYSRSSVENKIAKSKKARLVKKKKTNGELKKNVMTKIKLEADGDQYIKRQVSLPSLYVLELSKLEVELKIALERSRRITLKSRRGGN